MELHVFGRRFGKHRKNGTSMYELSYAEDAENDIGDRDLENDCNDQQI